MTPSKKQLLLSPCELYRQSKSWFNYLCDRVIDHSNMFLMDVYYSPWPSVQKIAHWIARFMGDLSWLLSDFPRLSAYKLGGVHWTIIFVGKKQELSEILYLFFQDEKIVPQEIERVALWRLPAQTKQWLAGEADLVICELSRICPWKPKAPITFTTPNWINQVLSLPEPLEDVLYGKQMKTVRNNLNKAIKAGFCWYFSQTKEDFDHFHYRMYLPYIQARHGERALLSSYQNQWEQWFVRGGLIMLTQNHVPVGGVICYVHNNICSAIELGVLDANPELIESGFKTALDWFVMNWAYQQRIRTYNMGGTRPWRSDGVFFTKSRWRTKVVRRKRIYSVWTFLSQNLSPALQNHLNELGPISEMVGKFYGVWLNNCMASLDQDKIHNELLAAQAQGLAGVMVIKPNTKPVLHDSVSQRDDLEQ